MRNFQKAKEDIAIYVYGAVFRDIQNAEHGANQIEINNELKAEDNILSLIFLGGKRMKKKRGCLGLIFDFVLTLLTGGLWLIWILIRYLRNNS